LNCAAPVHLTHLYLPSMVEAFFALTGTSGGTPGHPLSEIPKRAPVHPSHFRFLYLEFRKDAVPFRVIAALGA
jgi:hypothetical protein